MASAMMSFSKCSMLKPLSRPPTPIFHDFSRQSVMSPPPMMKFGSEKYQASAPINVPFSEPFFNFNAQIDNTRNSFELMPSVWGLPVKDSFASLQEHFIADLAAQQVVKEVCREIRGRRAGSGTNITNLFTPLPEYKTLQYHGKHTACNYCAKQNPRYAKTHPMKFKNCVVCPILRQLKCRLCGTPDKDQAHTYRFCPLKRFK